MGRSPCCDKSKVKRGSWSPEEDATLKAYLLNHGTGGNWIALPQKAGLLRCGKSCRLRWLNYLRPDIKHGAFTQEEDDIIINIYSKIGSRWSAIASHLPGRTDNDVKNHWNTKLRKKLMPPNNNTKITNTSLDKTTTFQASTDSLIPPTPKFAVQFPGISTSYDQAMNFHSPRLILDGPSSTSPFTMAHQDSDLLRIPSSWMNENYGVNGIIPNEEFSFDFMSAIGSHGDADLFSIFQFDSKPQGVSQSH